MNTDCSDTAWVLCQYRIGIKPIEIPLILNKEAIDKWLSTCFVCRNLPSLPEILQSCGVRTLFPS